MRVQKQGDCKLLNNMEITFIKKDKKSKINRINIDFKNESEQLTLDEAKELKKKILLIN